MRSPAAQKYIERAKRCEWRAVEFANPVVKNQFAKLAAQWREIAAKVEQLEWERRPSTHDLLRHPSRAD